MSPEFIKWLEEMASSAFYDLLRSVKEGNLGEVKAHAERIEFVTLVTPWLDGELQNSNIEIKFQRNE